MFYWIYDIPTLLVVCLFVVVFVGVCWLGIILSRPFVRSWFHQQADLNEIVGVYIRYFGVIYGLLLGLIAVGTYQNFAAVEKAVASEASALAALYRDVSAYPEPIRSELQDEIRAYTRFVIDEAWPLQRKGIVPTGGVTKAARIHESLAGFEPHNKAQEALHDATLRQFNTFFDYRRSRIYSVTAGLPAIMWYTVGIGAVINMIFLCLFDLRLGVHLLLAGLISFFTATMVSLIALVDNPFRGEVSVPPLAFELIYNQMMKE